MIYKKTINRPAGIVSTMRNVGFDLNLKVHAITIGIVMTGKKVGNLGGAGFKCNLQAILKT